MRSCSGGARVAILVAVALLTGILLWWEWPGSNHAIRPKLPSEVVARSHMPPAEGASCVDCHAHIVEAWATSQHARANRLLKDVSLAPGEVSYGGTHTMVDKAFRANQSGTSTFDGIPVGVIGVEPLVQLLMVTSNGQWQAFNPAYHTQSNFWFNVFQEERTPEDWGHWSRRGMNWNVQCAWCHMTNFEKRYDAVTDSYDSHWQAMGIACAQCHGDLSAHAKDPKTAVAKDPSRPLAMEACMTCHARREFLTPEGFKPGDRFADHFRLTLFDSPGTFYPDGQVRDEDFETASFLSSKMHAAGVNCMDCHDPHSGNLKLPVQNNVLCMSCHTTPGRMGAIPIEPEQHSHHKPGGSGFQCVNCHMPTTTYMAHDKRRDHGFTVPDPLLTRELGIPNACSRCHTDQDVDWAVTHAESWYGEKLAARRTRPRARAIQRAWDGDPTVVTNLVDLAATEDLDLWRASLLRLLQPFATRPDAAALLQQSLSHTNAMVRGAAVHALSVHPDRLELLTPLRKDESRGVRMDAALATLETGRMSQELRDEVEAYLDFNADQPAGALRRAQYALAMNRREEAVSWAQRLLRYDSSAEPQVMAGRIFHAAGRLPDAVTALMAATRQAPDHSDAWYTLALLNGEAGDLTGARDAFARVVELEPDFGRAWYNLGLARIQLGDAPAGLEDLQTAERLMPESGDPAYALATQHFQNGNPAEAREALRKALERDPGHRPSRQMLRQLQGP